MEWKTKHYDYKAWNEWFAWYPINLELESTTVWLEFVERTWFGGFDTGNWVYRRK